MVHVNMEDHRHEEYKPVAPKIKPFAGKGHTLGSPTPAVTDSSIASAIPSSTSSASNEENEKLYVIFSVNSGSFKLITLISFSFAGPPSSSKWIQMHQ